MNSISKNLFSNIISTWEYKAILLYILIGSFFTVSQLAGASYLEMFIGSFSNKIFLIVILYPSFIAMFLMLFKFFNKNDNLLLRLGDRKKFVLTLIVQNIYMSLFLFIQAIIITLIICNITYNIGFRFENKLGYDVPDIYVSIVVILKILFTIILISLINSLIMLKYRNTTISIMILMSLMTLIFFGNNFYPSGIKIIDMLNPGYNSHGYMFDNKIISLVYSGILYFSTTITFLVILIFKVASNSNIGVE